MLTNFKRNFALNIMQIALGALYFAQTGTTSGASGAQGKTSAKKPASNGEGGEGEQVVNKRPPTRVKSLSDLETLPADERAQLETLAGLRANVPAGTVGQYVRADGKGLTDDKNLAKRAMGGTGRLIAAYTPPRPGDAVAIEELKRLLRLKWSREARIRAQAAQAKRKTPLTEEDVVKILHEVGAPKSYMRPAASKQLWGRVVSHTLSSDPLPAETVAPTGGNTQS